VEAGAGRQRERHSTGRQAQGDAIVPPTRTTDILANAQELRFVPRIYITDYSPIMRAEQKAEYRRHRQRRHRWRRNTGRHNSASEYRSTGICEAQRVARTVKNEREER